MKATFVNLDSETADALTAAATESGLPKRVIIEGALDAMAGRETQSAEFARRAWARYRKARR